MKTPLTISCCLQVCALLLIGLLVSFSSCQYECFGESDIATVCSGRGMCVMNDTCDCTQPFYGDKCENFDCFNVVYQSPSVCTYHGKCVAPNTCTCDAGFGGEMCDAFICNGIISTNASVCDGNGRCIGPDVCLCNGGTTASSCPNVVIKPGEYNISTIAGSGFKGYLGDGGLAIDCQMDLPQSLAIIGSSYLIADSKNHVIRKVTNGIITTIAGTGESGFSGDLGLATNAKLNFPSSVVVNSKGEIFISDSNNNRIRKISLNGTISTYAGKGGSGTFSGDNGAATDAFLNFPLGLAFHPITDDLYFADSNNNRIRKISTASGIITTVAGTWTSGFSGDGGLATDCELNGPNSIAFDSLLNLYISDVMNYRIRIIFQNGTISTFAGTGSNGFAGDNGPASNAQFDQISTIAISRDSMFITANNRVRMISLSSGIIKTIAGTGGIGYTGDGGPATRCTFQGPVGLAINSTGSILVSDSQNNVVRMLTTGCNLETHEIIDGTCQPIGIKCQEGQMMINGKCLSCDNGVWINGECMAVCFGKTNLDVATICSGKGVCVKNDTCDCMPPFYGEKCENYDCFNVTYQSPSVCSYHGKCVAPNSCTCDAGFGGEMCDAFICSGIISTNASVCDGNGRCIGPDVCLCNGGTTANSCPNVVIKPGEYNISTIAGSGFKGYLGDGALAINCQMDLPQSLAIIGSSYLIADSKNHVIRKVSNGIITTIAGTGERGFSGDGDLATNAKLNFPSNVVVNSKGEIFISDSNNNRIRKISLNGTISTYAGKGGSGTFSGDNGAATDAFLNFPLGLAFHPTTNDLYFADSNNNRIRKVSITGIITTVAGTWTSGFSGDGASAINCELNSPNSIAFDSLLNLYISDVMNFRIRIIFQNGTISTFAGTGSNGFAGDNGPASNAQFEQIGAVAISRDSMFITANNRVRMISLSSGIIKTIAGTGGIGYTGDGGPATRCTFQGPTGLAINSTGSILVSDSQNNVVRIMSTNCNLETNEIVNGTCQPIGIKCKEGQKIVNGKCLSCDNGVWVYGECMAVCFGLTNLDVGVCNASTYSLRFCYSYNNCTCWNGLGWAYGEACTKTYKAISDASTETISIWLMLKLFIIALFL